MALAVVRTAQQRLKDSHFSRLKCPACSCHAQQPDPVSSFRHQLSQCLRLLLEAVDPAAKREGIVFPQVLDVSHLETRRLGNAQRMRDCHQLGIWKYKLMHKGILLGRSGERDAVVQKDTSRFEAGECDREILRHVFDTDVLEHTDAGNGIEGLGNVAQGAIVAQLNLASLTKPALGYTSRRDPGLLLAQGDAMRVNGVFIRGVQHEAPPAAADVKESVGGSKP